MLSFYIYSLLLFHYYKSAFKDNSHVRKLFIFINKSDAQTYSRQVKGSKSSTVSQFVTTDLLSLLQKQEIIL